MKQYHLIKWSLASGELLEPLVLEEKAVLMPFGRIPMKILHNWAELQPEGWRNQELAIVLSSLLWCFNFRPDIYVVRFQTLPWFLCAAFPRTRTNFRKAICSSVKTSNISLVPSSFFFLFNKSHHFWCLFKDFFFPRNGRFRLSWPSLFSISSFWQGWHIPWATVAALISSPEGPGDDVWAQW